MQGQQGDNAHATPSGRQPDMQTYHRTFCRAQELYQQGKLADAEEWFRRAESIALQQPPGTFTDAALQDVRDWIRRCATARHGGADADRATSEDFLGLLPAAKGVAMFLLHPKTSTTAVAVYGPWGQGKSTFMHLVERELQLQAAFDQVEMLERIDDGVLHTRYVGIEQRIESYQADDEDRALLEALASPRLLTVWFNAWEYITEEQVWGGLIVETTRELERKVGPGNRRSMRYWWRGLKWLPRLLLPLRTLIAVRYNWQQRRSQLILYYLLPLLAVLALVISLTVFGVTQVRSVTAGGKMDSTAIQAATAAVALSGFIVSVLTVVERTMKVIKQISDSIQDGLSVMSLNKHSGRVGYQQAVRKDMAILKALLESSLKPFRDYRPPITAAKKAAHLAAVEHARRSAMNARVAKSAAESAAVARAAACQAGTAKEKEDAALAVEAAKTAALKAKQSAEAAKNATCAALRSARIVEASGSCPESVHEAWAEAEKAAHSARGSERAAHAAIARAACTANHDIEQPGPPQPTMATSAARSTYWHWRQRAPVLPAIAQQFRIVVFIDDLDRCQPNKVVEVLEAINVVLANSNYSVVIGVDRDVMCHAIKNVYKDVGLTTSEQADIFLEKVVQVDLTLPVPNISETKRYLKAMDIDVDGLPAHPDASSEATSSTSSARAAEPQSVGTEANGQSGLGAGPSASVARPVASSTRRRELQSLTISRTYSDNEKRAVSTIIKKGLLTGTSPRSIKRLLNHYRLAKHIYLQQVESSETAIEPGEPEEVYMQLLGWLTAWWRYPQGMSALIQVAAGDTSWQCLSELLNRFLMQQGQQQQQQQVLQSQSSPGVAADVNIQSGAGESAEQQSKELLALRDLMSGEAEQHCRAMFDLKRDRVTRFRMFGKGFMII